MYKITNLLHDLYATIWHKYHERYFKIASNFTRLTAREIMYDNFEVSLVAFMPSITTNQAIIPIYICLYVFLKEFKDSAFLKDAGMLFHNLGPAIENLRSP